MLSWPAHRPTAYNPEMPVALVPHRATPCGAVESLLASVWVEERAFSIIYVVTGDIEALSIPDLATPERTDGLWNHTCFEVFVRGSGSPAYCELNFSPSTQWAAYRFDDYRSGMTELSMAAAPRIAVDRAAHRLELRVSFELTDDALILHEPLHLALAAVIEMCSQRRTYWALAHPSTQPDFHHPAAFSYSPGSSS